MKESPSGLPALAYLAIALLGSCSSVEDINGLAVLVRSDSSPSQPAQPPAWIPPAKTEYRVGARDLLEIDIYELEEPNKTKQIKTRIAQDGGIMLPLIGRVEAAGKTIAELQADIESKLGKDYLVHPSASVFVAEYQARRVTVLGAVKSPGTFTLRQNTTTLVDALALAGGVTEEAGSALFVVRAAAEGGGDGQTAGAGGPAGVADASARRVSPAGTGTRLVEVDLVDLMERGDLSANCPLYDGDLVQVPPAAKFFVTGHVKSAGSFPLRGEITVLKAIALAGGLKDSATPSATVIIRKTEQGRRKIPVDLTEVKAGSDKDLIVMPDDVILVSQSGTDKFLHGVGSFFAGLFNISYGVR